MADDERRRSLRHVTHGAGRRPRSRARGARCPALQRPRQVLVAGFDVGGSRSNTGAAGANPASSGLLRLWAWAAISRGAAALSVDERRVSTPATTIDRQGGSGLQALAEMAGVVGRNSSLFAPLRPHPSRIAILWSVGGPGDSALNAWQALSDTNIQVDFVHPGELVSGTASLRRPLRTRRGRHHTGDDGGAGGIRRVGRDARHRAFDQAVRTRARGHVGPRLETVDRRPGEGQRPSRAGQAVDRVRCAGGESWKWARVPAAGAVGDGVNQRWHARGRSCSG